MIRLAPRLLEDAPALREHDRVSGNDESRVGHGCDAIGERGFVDGEAFLVCGLQDVFEGFEVLGKVFGFGGREDFEVCEANLCVVSNCGLDWRRRMTVLEQVVVFVGGLRMLG